jgi:nucleoside-diphosphate-sugar epimerase
MPSTSRKRKPQVAFVTGGSGFIGRHVVSKLLSRGYAVRALARSAGSAEQLRALGAEPIPGDITDRDSMRDGMTGATHVFHLAAAYDYSPEGRQLSEALNIGGTRNVLGLAHELGVPRIVYTSTLAVYGDTHGALVDETYRADGPFLSEYDRTKWEAHYHVALPLIAQGAPIVIVLPGVAYGPGDRSWLAEMMRLFYRGLLPVLPGPETQLTYAHVEDIAEGHILAAETGKPGESYNLAGPAIPLGEMVDFWAQLTGRRPPAARVPARYVRGFAPVAGRVQPALSLPTAFSEELVATLGATYIASSEKARTELGWRARPLQTGMMETLEWIAATEPPDMLEREKAAARVALFAALGLFIVWLWGRRRRRRGAGAA